MAKPHPRMQEAREEYIAGGDDVTLEVLAEKYSIPFNSLRGRSAREKWVKDRKQYRVDVKQKTMKKAANIESEIRGRQIKRGQLMQEVSLLGTKQHMLGTDPNGKPYSKLTDAKELRLWMIDGADLERKAAGLPNGDADVLVNLNVTPDDVERLSDEELSALRAKIKSALG